jgi:hypothetical protein
MSTCTQANILGRVCNAVTFCNMGEKLQRTQSHVDEGCVAGGQTMEKGSTYVSIDDAKVENRSGRAEKRGGGCERDGRCHRGVGANAVSTKIASSNVTGAIFRPARLCLQLCLDHAGRALHFVSLPRQQAVFRSPRGVHIICSLTLHHHHHHQRPVVCLARACCCAHLLTMEEAAQLMILKGTFEPDPSGVPFSGDGGLFRWLGSNGGTTEYVNPHTTRKVIVTASSLYGTLEKFIQHTPPGGAERNYTNNEPGLWVAVQLAVAVVLKGYDLRHGLYDGSWVLRNWNLEGSNDGVEWVVLHQHVNDTSLAETAHSTASWEVNNPNGLAFSRFRIIMTGPNSGGDHDIFMMGLELYGRVEGGGGGFPPGTVRNPTLPAALSLGGSTALSRAATMHKPRTPFARARKRPPAIPSARSLIVLDARVHVRVQHRRNMESSHYNDNNCEFSQTTTPPA